MRATRFKLVNNIAIYAGMGLKEIEIFFPEGNNKILLLGDNGKGKTTILNQFHLLKDSQDNRKSWVIEGEEGIKEIDIDDDGDIYEIKHVCGKKTFSFIKKNGVELNENGGVRTFEALIEEHLGFNKDYFVTGRIGDTTPTFVKYTTAKRKEYIGTQVQAVGKYNDAYKIVNEKYKTATDDINRLSKRLGTLSELDVIESAIDDNEKETKELNEIIPELNIKIGELNAEITKTKTEIDKCSLGASYIQLKDKLNKLEHLKREADLTMIQFKDIFTNTDEAIETLKEDLVKANTNIQVETVKLEQLEKDGRNVKQRIQAQNDIVKQNEIKKVSLKKQTKDLDRINEVKKELEDLKQQKKDFQAKFDNNPLYQTIMDTENISSNIASFKTFRTFMNSNHSTLISKDTGKHANIEIFFVPEVKTTLGTHMAEARAKIEAIRKETKAENEDKAKNEANVGKLAILDKRPTNCSIDTCPFIKDALQYKNVGDLIVANEARLKQYGIQLDNAEKASELLQEVIDLYKTLQNTMKALEPKTNVLYREYVKRFGRITHIVNISDTESYNELSSVVNQVEQMLIEINKFKTLDNEINLKNANIERIESVVTLVESYDVNIKEAEENAKTIEESQGDLLKSIEDKRKALEEDKIYIANAKKFLEAAERLKTISGDMKAAAKDIKSYETHSAAMVELQNTLNATKSLILTHNDKLKFLASQLIKLNVELNTVKEIKAELKTIEDGYEDIKQVRAALDPKSGIPLIFIKTYLGRTEEIVNDLLDIAFDGRFEVKFEATDSDFYIPVTKDGILRDDIDICSTGEKALTTISINLALMEQKMSESGRYNIIGLDEVDGGLDSTNREAFISILDRQIENTGIEQVMFISHNNAFYNAAVDLIILPLAEDADIRQQLNNADFMANKRILWDNRDGDM